MFTVRLKDRDLEVADLPTLARQVKAGKIDANTAVYDHLREEWTLAGTVTAPPRRMSAAAPAQLPATPVAAAPAKLPETPVVAAPPKPAPSPPVAEAPKPVPAAPPRPAPTPPTAPPKPPVNPPAKQSAAPDASSEPAWAREPVVASAKPTAPPPASPKKKKREPAPVAAPSPTLKKSIERWVTRAAAVALFLILVMAFITYAVEHKDQMTAAAEAAKNPPATRHTAVTPTPAPELAMSPTPPPVSFTGGQFEGVIGKRDITMTLTASDADRTLAGSFRYEGKGRPLPVSGAYETDGRFTLAEKIDGKVVAEFTGTVTSDSLSGEWRTKSGKRSLAFRATRSD